MHSERAQNLIKQMPEGFQAALISSSENRFYFLDFDSHDAGFLLIFPHRMIFIVDSRYIEAAQKKVQGAEVVLQKESFAQIEAFLKEEGVKTLFLENTTTLAGLALLRQKLPKIEFDTTPALSRAIKNLRMVKQPQEIERIKKAQQITDACFTHILPFIKPGVCEVDLMLEMEHYMRSNGAEKVAFDTICIAGQNTSLPHGVPGGYRLREGDFITMDFGAKVQGYCTDMTRTVALGKVCAEQTRIYDTVLEAQLSALKAVKAGAVGRQVDKVARDIIDAAGYKGCFGHGLGHSLGLAIHEEPRFSPKDENTIQAGMLMTVEPGIYLPGRFGCRIEDTVLVTQTGCEILAQSDKQLLIL